MKRLARKLALLLLAKFLRRRIVRLARRWAARRLRRTGSSSARSVFRRGARSLVLGAARLSARSPLRYLPLGERLIPQLFVLAEALGAPPTHEETA